MEWELAKGIPSRDHEPSMASPLKTVRDHVCERVFKYTAVPKVSAIHGSVRPRTGEFPPIEGRLGGESRSFSVELGRSGEAQRHTSGIQGTRLSDVGR